MARPLTDKQEKFVKARAKGVPRDESAILAGYADSDMVGRQVEESAAVQEALQKEIEEARRNAKISKEEVTELLREAANMARLLADPTGLVAAARELGKLHGFYAPEIKKHEHNLGERTLAALENMSDADLLKIAGGRVIDGESRRVPDEAVPSLPALDPAGGAEADLELLPQG